VQPGGISKPWRAASQAARSAVRVRHAHSAAPASAAGAAAGQRRGLVMPALEEAPAPEIYVDAVGAVSMVTDSDEVAQPGVFRNVDGHRGEDGRYAAFTEEITGFIPRERQFTDPVRTFAYGTDASFYRLNPRMVVKARAAGSREYSTRGRFAGVARSALSSFWSSVTPREPKLSVCLYSITSKCERVRLVERHNDLKVTCRTLHRVLTGCLRPQVHTEAEISRILPIARRLGVPVTFRAAGTSLSGQAITDSVLLKLSHTGKNFRRYQIHVRRSLPVACPCVPTLALHVAGGVCGPFANACQRYKWIFCKDSNARMAMTAYQNVAASCAHATHAGARARCPDAPHAAAQGDGSSITVEPGLIGGEINRLLAAHQQRNKHPIMYKIGPDPSSIDSCMVGGMVANNSSGMCCGVSQNTYHTLRDLRAVFADGSVLDTADPASRAAWMEVRRLLCAPRRHAGLCCTVAAVEVLRRSVGSRAAWAEWRVRTSGLWTDNRQERMMVINMMCLEP